MGGTTVSAMLEEYGKHLQSLYSRNEIRQLFYTLAEEYLGWQKPTVHLESEHLLPVETARAFALAMNRLASGEPVEYITGKSLFNGNIYLVNPGVLIPRPETEELCQMIVRNHAADKYKELSILDIGTGSGCIAIDLALHLPYAKVTAIDHSGKAVETARLNALTLGAKVHFIQSDMLLPGDFGEPGGFDLVVSNPPYVTLDEKKLMKANVLDFEPPEAIFVNDKDPFLFYRAIISRSARQLKRPGWIYLEINERFGKEISGILKKNGFEKIEITRDIFGKDRFASAAIQSRIEDISYWYGE